MKGKKVVSNKNELSVEALQNELWNTLQNVKAKKINVQAANSIISAAKEICNITRLELQYRAMTSNNQKLESGSVPLLEKVRG